MNIFGCNFTGNGFTTGITGAQVNISNTIFLKNSLTAGWISSGYLYLSHSQFIQDVYSYGPFFQATFSPSIITDVTFDSVYMTSSEYSAQLITIQNKQTNLFTSIISRINAFNVTSNSLINIIDSNANITDSIFNSCLGLITDNSGLNSINSRIALENIIVNDCFNASFNSNFILEGTFLSFQNITVTNTIGGRMGLFSTINSGVQSLSLYSNINISRTDTAIYHSGDGTISGFIYEQSVCQSCDPGAYPMHFERGSLFMENVFLDLIDAKMSSPFYLYAGALHGLNITIQNCISGSGGAIYSKDSVIELEQFSSFNNSAQEKGGALYIEGGIAYVRDSSFLENHAILGGGIYCADTQLNINNTILDSNQAEYGGGIYLQHTDVNWNMMTCNNHVALQDGGCVFSRNLVSTEL